MNSKTYLRWPRGTCEGHPVPSEINASRVTPIEAIFAHHSELLLFIRFMKCGLRFPFVAGVLACTAALLFSGCTTAPTEYLEPAALSAADRTALNRRVFDRTWTLVDKKYFDAKFRGADWPALRAKYEAEALTAPDSDTLYRVLNRMCGELKESHLGALTPRQAHETRNEHRAGIGLRWTLVDEQRVVTEVVPGGPAAVAGVEPGWLILSRNGQLIPVDDTFRPRLGEPVSYVFADAENLKHEFTFQPALLNFERLEVRELPGGFTYLRFDEFSRRTLHWLSEQLKAHRDTRGVVLDLRSNPGGNLLALNVAVAEFFPKTVDLGRLVKRNGRERTNESVSWLSARFSGPVVILTDHPTGSAAEIFAHVLQFHHRATVMGRTTAGAVIVSRRYRLPDGGTLQVPVMDYVGLNGRRLEGRGVTPDRPLPPLTLADRRARLDPDLADALKFLAESAATP